MADKPLFPKGKARKGKGGKHHLLLYGLLAVAAAGGIWLYTRNQQQKKSATASPTTQATGAAYSTSPAVGTLASQVPQFVNQTYVNPTPPQVTQTTNITNKPQPVPRPVHITINQGDEDRKRRQNSHSGWKGPHLPPTPGPGGHGTPGPKPPRHVIIPPIGLPPVKGH